MSGNLEYPVKRTLNGKIVESDINKLLKDKKKDEVIQLYAQESGLPVCLLEQIWGMCEKLPEKKLKQIKKGQYKNKLFNPKRPEIKDGMVFETATVRDLTEEEKQIVVVTNEEPDKIEELEDNVIV